MLQFVYIFRGDSRKGTTTRTALVKNDKESVGTGSAQPGAYQYMFV